MVEVSEPLAEILDGVGVVVVPCRQRLRPGTTHAVATLEALLADYGSGHVVAVLRSLNDAGREPGRHLTAPVIGAISDLLLAHPRWFDAGEAWLAALDDIDLAEIERLAHAGRGAVRKRQAIAALLFARLEPRFGGPPRRRAIKSPMEAHR